eukprot:2471699-Amphidinium_carterae.1
MDADIVLTLLFGGDEGKVNSPMEQAPVLIALVKRQAIMRDVGGGLGFSVCALRPSISSTASPAQLHVT